MKIKRAVAKFWELYDRLVRWSIGKLLMLLHIEWSENRWKEFLAFARFWLVGLSATLVNYLTNVIVLLSIHVTRISYDFVIANIAGFFVSVIWTYYWNNKHVFRQEEDTRRPAVRTFLKTLIAYAFTGLILNNVLSYLFIFHAGISKYAAPILNMLIGFPVNFLMNRLWAFK